MNFKGIIQTAKAQAKQLTVDISRIGDDKTNGKLQVDSIELLLSINLLETLYNLKLEHTHGWSRIVEDSK